MYSYEKLIEDYQLALINNLRAFGQSDNVLYLWVPSDDLGNSLISLLKSAKFSGLHSFQLTINNSSLMEDNTVLLTKKIKEVFPSFEIAKIDDLTSLITVRDLINDRLVEHGLVDHVAPATTCSADQVKLNKHLSGDIDVPTHIPDLYLNAALKLEASNRSGENISGESIDLSVSYREVILNLSLSAKGLVIKSCGFEGLCPALQDFYGKFSNVLIGLPFFEAVHHGVYRFVGKLIDIDVAVKNKVNGIYLPETVEPIFGFMGHMLYLAKKKLDVDNQLYLTAESYDPLPNIEWMSLSRDQRIKLVQQSIDLNKAPTEYINCVDIEYDVRLIVDVENVLPGRLFVFEKAIRADIDERLELFLSELKDRNKIRKIKVVSK